MAIVPVVHADVFQRGDAQDAREGPIRKGQRAEVRHDVLPAAMGVNPLLAERDVDVRGGRPPVKIGDVQGAAGIQDEGGPDGNRQRQRDFETPLVFSGLELWRQGHTPLHGTAGANRNLHR